jgi:retron-type reverse transcriptase
MHFSGTPSSRNEVVREAIKMLLELVFEPRMGDGSYEFGPGRSIHLALRTICKWTGTIWLIEGTIKGYFDNIAYTILASLLMKEVKDRQILDLYWKLVRAEFVNNKKQEPHNLMGVLQGEILSPLLSNIYLHEFDVCIKNLAASLRPPGKVSR